MDYSLRIIRYQISTISPCLNPYSNGLLSEFKGEVEVGETYCLNPYSNGLLSEIN